MVWCDGVTTASGECDCEWQLMVNGEEFVPFEQQSTRERINWRQKGNEEKLYGGLKYHSSESVQINLSSK